MITVVKRDGTTVALPPRSGATILDLCRAADIEELEAVCGGNCSCATCHVYVPDGQGAKFPSLTEDENDLLDASSHRTPQSRLACQLTISSENVDLTIMIAPED